MRIFLGLSSFVNIFKYFEFVNFFLDKSPITTDSQSLPQHVTKAVTDRNTAQSKTVGSWSVFKHHEVVTSSSIKKNFIQTTSMYKKLPPTIIIYPNLSKVKIQKGASIKLHCFGHGSPDPLIQWKKLNGTPINNATKLISSIFILNAKQNDEGTYACHANNEVGGTKNSIKLLVQRYDSILRPNRYKVIVGNRVDIVCDVKDSNDTLVWMRQNLARSNITKILPINSYSSGNTLVSIFSYNLTFCNNEK